MQITKTVRSLVLLCISMVFSLGMAYAQQITIKGLVTAAGDEPLPGVTVVVKGTVTGTITDIDGNYTLNAPNESAILSFSFVGYKTQEITVGSQTTINVVLEADVMGIDEVVVTGYSVQRKRDLTGAVGIVEAEELKAQPTGNVANQLQGRTSGVTVIGSGEPGETSKVRIRGFSSFENNDPLYIVDGVPTQDISNLNPNDIQSMSVLKDAGAASIYGSRASNGVIVVTTKRGDVGVKVTYDMYYGVQDPGKGPTGDLLSSQEYANLQWLVYDNDGTVEEHPVYGLSTNASPTMPSWAANTNWYDEISDPAPIMNHDISFSGGNQKSRFFVGLGYFDQEGIVKYNYSKKFTARFNSEFKVLNDRLTVGENFTIMHRSGVGVGNLSEASPINSASYRLQSIIPAVITEEIQGTNHLYLPGEWGGTGIAPRLGNSGNTLAGLTRNKDDISQNLRFMGSVYANLEIMPGLNFKTTFGGSHTNWYWVDYTFATYESAENTATPSFTEGAGYSGDWTWSNQLNYSKSFGDHEISALVGYEANKYNIWRQVYGTRADYFSDDVDFRTLSNGASIITAESSANTPVTLVSQFAKADYNYKGKYILSATIRRDGSSVFSSEKRYGIFPAFAAGWQLGDEDFMAGAEWLDNLKIRGSWGTMGNQMAVSPMNAFYLYGGSANQSFYDIQGTGNSSVQGFRPTRIGNPDAQWETNVTTDIGFEAMIFDGKVGLVFDWYSKQTEDLLYALELPGVAGGASVPYVNVASMSNKGIDVELSYKENWGDFAFDASATITTVNNEITKIADGIEFFDYGDSRIGGFNRNEVGHPMAAFFGYEVDRLFQESDFDSNGDLNSNVPTQDGAEAGFLKFVDTDGDGEITPDDRTYIGNPNPDFTYGLNLGLSWKNFDLTAFFYGAQGNEIFNYNKWWVDFWPSFQGQKSTDLLYNSWTPTNTNATVPKASNTSNFSTNAESNSYYVEDGSFLRLKNLTLGYTLPESVISKIHFSSARVYVQGVNLFTITNYSGLDPEIGGDDRSFGVDEGNYPTVKQFIFGLNITL